MNEPLIHPRHIRGVVCMKGARAWYKQNDLSWSDCLSKGTPVSVVEATGCPIAARVVAKAREEAANG